MFILILWNNSEKTLQAKMAYEKLLLYAGHTVKHYHADNGRLADNGFLDAFNSKEQKIILWSRCPSSKWNCWTQKQRTYSRCLHSFTSWYQNMTTNDWPNVLAICNQSNGRKVKFTSSKYQKSNARINFIWHPSQREPSKVVSYSLLPSLYTEFSLTASWWTWTS